MDIREAIRQCIGDEARVMQLATMGNDRPWICTVWFVADDNLNLYWLSLPNRRHSQEIEANRRVAVAVAIKYDMPTIGLQVEGTAERVEDPKVVKRVMKRYVAKYDEGELFYERMRAGTNQHVLYRLRPEVCMVTDGVHFSHNEPVEWRPEGIK